LTNDGFQTPANMGFITLGVDEIEFMLRGTEHRLPCEVVLTADPKPRLSFLLTGLDPMLLWASQETFSVQFVRADVRCDVFVGSIQPGMISLSPTKEPIESGRSQGLAEIQFDLINFPSFWAREGTSRRGPDDTFDISTTEWQVQIRPPRSGAEVEALQSPHYSVTHSCLVQKIDGTVI
jgi:hypothetical protein